MGTGKVMNREKSQFINELENKCLDFSGDSTDNKNKNILSLKNTSFNWILHNNVNNFNNNNNNYNNNNYNNYNKYNSNYNYKKWNYYLNKKRNIKE